MRHIPRQRSQTHAAARSGQQGGQVVRAQRAAHVGGVLPPIGAGEQPACIALHDPSGWTATQVQAMRWLQRANLKTARAWRLKMALREVFANARVQNQAELAGAELKA